MRIGITARLLLIPVASALLLVGVLLYTGRTQVLYDESARAVVAHGVGEARTYAGLLDRTQELHGRYLDLATSRLVEGLGPRQTSGTNALLGALLDLNAEIDEQRNAGRAGDRERLAQVSDALMGFQDTVARLATDRTPQQMRADIVESNAMFDGVSATLTQLISTAETSGDAAFAELQRHVRHALVVIALVLGAVVACIVAMVWWTRRGLARPLSDLATAMARFRADATAEVRVPVRGDDEIAQIATGFNALVETVQARSRELDAGTQLLRESNAALHAEIAERRAAEAELRRSRELLEAAQSVGGVGVFDLDLETGELHGSRQFFTLLALPPATAAITQDQWLALVHPEDLEALADAFSRAVAEDASFAAEYRSLRRDRSTCWLSCAGRVLVDETRGARRIVGSIVDITRRRRAEDELRSVADSLQLAQSAGGVATFDVDFFRGTAQHSPNLAEMLGLAPGVKVERDRWLACIHPEDRDRARYPVRETTPEGHRYRSEYRVVAGDGSLRWLHEQGTLVRDSRGHRMRLAGTLVDVTERKRAEAALADAQERLARAVQGTSDGLWEWQSATGGLWLAPRVAELLGYAPEALPTAMPAFFELLHPEDVPRVVAANEAHVQRGVPYDIELRLRDANGEWQWFRSRARASRAGGEAGDGPLIVSGSLQLVTDRRRQAEELERARLAAEQASLAKSEFLANMSHEIRTPINGVIGMTHVLLDSALTPDQRECVEIVRSSGESLLTLVNDILDFSKIEAGRMELEAIEVDVRKLVDEAIAATALGAGEKRLELVARVAPDVPAALRGDPGRLRQCLLNLLGNAVKFTPEGHVALDVAVVAEAASDDEALVRFTVADTGIGIAPERLDRLFREFSQVDSSTTRHFGGTGLGLSIVRRLAELMGGAVGVHSVPDTGSTFWFTACLARTESAVAPSSAARHEQRVLVLDDREIAALYAAAAVEACGYSTEWFTTVEALRARLAGDATPFAAALVEQGFAGLETHALLRELRAASPGLRVAVLAPLGAAVATSGADATLSKPLRASLVAQCLDRWFGAAPAPVPAAPTPAQVAPRTRVLLVEDNAVNRRVAEHQLVKLGCSVGVAENGVEALAAWAAERWDLVLMDCQMPLLDGFACAREIRRREGSGARVPIVALTAHALRGDREACLAAGMDDYLTKPLEPARLRAVLERWSPGVPGARRDLEERAPPPPAPAAPVDLAELRELTDGDADFERELVEAFVASGDRELAALVAALGSADLDGVRRHAHALKGASANLRAKRVAATAERLETAARAGDVASCRDAAAALDRDYRSAVEFLVAR